MYLLGTREWKCYVKEMSLGCQLKRGGFMVINSWWLVLTSWINHHKTGNGISQNHLVSFFSKLYPIHLCLSHPHTMRIRRQKEACRGSWDKAIHEAWSHWLTSVQEALLPSALKLHVDISIRMCRKASSDPFSLWVTSVYFSIVILEVWSLKWQHLCHWGIYRNRNSSAPL